MIDVPVPINLIDTPRATLEHDDPNDKAAQSMMKEVSGNSCGRLHCSPNQRIMNRALISFLSINNHNRVRVSVLQISNTDKVFSEHR